MPFFELKRDKDSLPHETRELLLCFSTSWKTMARKGSLAAGRSHLPPKAGLTPEQVRAGCSGPHPDVTTSSSRNKMHHEKQGASVGRGFPPWAAALRPHQRHLHVCCRVSSASTPGEPHYPQTVTFCYHSPSMPFTGRRLVSLLSSPTSRTFSNSYFVATGKTIPTSGMPRVHTYVHAYDICTHT